MKQEVAREGSLRYEVGSWRTDEGNLPFLQTRSDEDAALQPNARERGWLLGLLGLINYRVLTGRRVYIQVGGNAYRTLCGLYWRSVFTGAEHFLLRCEEVSGNIWTEGSSAVATVDLPITHTRDGWTAEGQSVLFLLNRD
jgi:hypothetical protein